MHSYILIILMFQYALTRHRGPVRVPVRILPKCPITASEKPVFELIFDLFIPRIASWNNCKEKGSILPIPYSEN